MGPGCRGSCVSLFVWGADMSNRSVVFNGVDDLNLLSAVPGARQFHNQSGKPRWVARVAGRYVGEVGGYASMRKALNVAQAARIKELTARGLWRSDEFGELV